MTYLSVHCWWGSLWVDEFSPHIELMRFPLRLSWCRDRPAGAEFTLLRRLKHMSTNPFSVFTQSILITEISAVMPPRFLGLGWVVGRGALCWHLSCLLCSSQYLPWPWKFSQSTLPLPSILALLSLQLSADRAGGEGGSGVMVKAAGLESRYRGLGPHSGIHVSNKVLFSRKYSILYGVTVG